jgi:hypothetical protein
VFARGVERAPPGPPYEKLSQLVKLPSFIPGIGILYVNPKTIPEGPWLAYDWAPDELGSQAVAQEVRVIDAVELYPAVLQPLAHYPRNGCRELEWSYWQLQRRTHTTIRLRPCVEGCRRGDGAPDREINHDGWHFSRLADAG